MGAGDESVARQGDDGSILESVEDGDTLRPQREEMPVTGEAILLEGRLLTAINSIKAAGIDVGSHLRYIAITPFDSDW